MTSWIRTWYMASERLEKHDLPTSTPLRWRSEQLIGFGKSGLPAAFGMNLVRPRR